VAPTGILAVSSLASTDIYENDKFLGSAPATIALPAGTHTLEYRHGNLRTKVRHIVRSNETTKAAVAFDVTVQINANPWADVFLDGASKKRLGQTPLSDIRVPIGSVLTFQNPKYPAKQYRVSGTETRIQIVFP
jgi:hypothetical protein